MPTLSKKVAAHVPGQFFVDDTCIDCDLCRQTAPAFFGREMIGITGRSVVLKQPRTPTDESLCLDALRACPVEAIVR